MDTKLTLKLDQKIIEKAKQYAESKNISLSSLVETYLAYITSTVPDQGTDTTPLVKSLSGILKDAPTDYKRSYRSHLKKKYT